MKIAIVTVLTVLFPVWLTAQTGGNEICRVKGILQDSISRSGEEYATGRLYRKSSPEKMEKAFVTQAGGKFEFQLKEPDEYVLRLSSVGKRDALKEFTFQKGNKTLDLGTLYVVPADNLMSGVTVVAQKPLVKMDVDKMEYDVEQDPDSKSDNMIEMLRKVPLVTVDGEDNIEVNGSKKFKIHINGKPNNMITNNPKEVLRSMPASSIKKIEVITNPGAKYDAEGVNGILNIITVGSKMQGYTASFNAGVSNTDVNGGIYTTVQKGKFTTTARYSYSHRNSIKSYDTSQRTVFSSTDNYKKTGNNVSSNTGNSHNGGIEASYEIDSLRLLTLSGNFYLGDGLSKTLADVNVQNPEMETTYSYDVEGPSKYTYGWIGGSVDYQRSFKRKKEELFTFSYRIGSSPNRSENTSNFFNVDMRVPPENTMIGDLTNMFSKSKSNSTEHTFQADYTNPITKMHELETGLKYILRRNGSDGQYFTAALGSTDYRLDPEKSSKYDYDQDILAAYLGYRLTWKNFSAKVGGRYEHTFQKVKYHVGGHSDFNAGFDDVVPSVLLSYKLSQSSNVRLGYNMRISRPGIWYLDPYVDRNSPGLISYGNPNLKSEKSHSFNVNYSRFSQKYYMNVSAYYSFVNNSIERYSFIQNDTTNSTYANIGKSRSTGFSYYFNWSITPTTRIYSNGNLNYSDYQSDEMGLRNHGFRFSANGGLQQTLPLEIRLSLNGGGATRDVRLQGRGGSYHYYGASLSREFMNKRLNVSVRANNFFEPYRTYSSTETTPDFAFSYNSRSFQIRYGLNISYRIGELKASVKKASRGIEKDDVKGGGAAESK